MGSPPPAFVCPITMEIMGDPYIAADGCSYEFDNIEIWLKKENRSPMTNVQLNTKKLVPNNNLRWAIEEWTETHYRRQTDDNVRLCNKMKSAIDKFLREIDNLQDERANKPEKNQATIPTEVWLAKVGLGFCLLTCVALAARRVIL